MRPLSATECISPAIARTKLVLFTPFRKGRTWKLCATSYLCRYGTMFFPFPLIYLFFIPAAHRTAGAFAVTLLCAGVLVAMAIFLVIFYLCSRLQFAFFDMVLNRGEFVAPTWRKYGPSSLPWSGLKLLLGTVITLACALPIAAYIRHVMPLFRSMQSLTPGQPPPPQFTGAIAAFYAGYALFFLGFGFFFFVSSLLSDFIVPSLALEDTGLVEAFRRMGELIRREAGEFFLYALLKTVLGVGAYIGAVIVWEIAFVLISLILSAIFGLIGFLLHLAGVPNAILIALAIFLGIVWYLFAAMYTMMFAIGPVLVFLDAYALYFLGGRYPLLGDLLDRSTPPPVSPYAPPFPPYPQPYYPPPAGPPSALS